MLKKAGIVVAASAASLLALTPLAFAGGEGGQDPGHGPVGSHNQNSQGKLLNALNGNNADVPIQACNNDLQGQVGLVPIQDVGENPTLPALNGAVNGEALQHAGVANTRACGEESGAGYGNR